MDEAAQACPSDGGGVEDVETLPPGARIDKYRIIRVLGEGGMGFVYEARDDSISRRVALKMLRPELAKHPLVAQRFLNEATSVNTINHDNIIKIDGYGEPHGSAYFVMEFLEGETLDDLMRKRQPMQVQLLLHLFGQICRALAAAHAKQIVHRDLKPANVFVVRSDNHPYFIKLLDFGIAQIRSEGAAKGLTVAGAVLGTPQYMSPEQVKAKDVDARTDVWAIGVMMYRAATGHAPFRGDNFLDLANKIINEPPPPVDAVVAAPRELAQLIASCLDPELDRRCPSITAVLEGFERVKQACRLTDEAILAAVRSDAYALDEPMPRAPGAPTRKSFVESHPNNQVPGVVTGPVLEPVLPSRTSPRRARIGAYAFGSAVVVLAVLGATTVARMKRGGDGDDKTAQDKAVGPSKVVVEAQPLPRTFDSFLSELAVALRAGDIPKAKQLAEAALHSALTTGTPEQQQAAIAAIARVPVPATARLLYAALNGSPEVRRIAAAALVELGSPEAIPKIRDALSSAGNLVKTDFSAALFRLGNRDGQKILSRALEEPGKRLVAAIALAAGGDKSGRPVLEFFAGTDRSRTDDWREANAALIALGDADARARLESELGHANAQRKVRAAVLLARPGNAAHELLAVLAADPQFSRRGEAALALARLGDQRALDWVQHGFTSADAEERAQAAAICGRLGSATPAHASAIADLVVDRDLEARMTATAAVLGF